MGLKQTTRRLAGSPEFLWSATIAILAITIFVGLLAATPSGLAGLDLGGRTFYPLLAVGLAVAAIAVINLIGDPIVGGTILVSCGLGFYWEVIAAQLSVDTRLETCFTGAIVLSISLVRFRAGRLHSRGDRLSLWLLVLIVLSPSVFLHSLPAVLYNRVGLEVSTLGYMLAVIVGVMGLPLGAAIWLSRTRSDAIRSRMINFLLAFSSVWLTVILLEVGGRAFDIVSPPSGTLSIALAKAHGQAGTIPGVPYEFVPNQTWVDHYNFSTRAYFSQDKTISYTVNNLGYRDTDFSVEKDASTYRIALLGDSFAFGQGVRQNDTAAVLLESLLSERTGCRVEIYNFAVPAYATIHEDAVLKYRAILYHPDMVIIWYVLNDAAPLPDMRGLRQNRPYRTAFPIAKQDSVILGALADRVNAALDTIETIELYHTQHAVDGAKWAAVLNSFQDMSQIAAQTHIPLVLFVHPVLYQLDNGYPFKDIHQQVIAAAIAHGMSAYDLFDAFNGQHAETLWVDSADSHPNEIAQSIAAHYAADKLAGLIPACGSK